jgi:uncharacterized protein (TIGR02117 family)
VVAAGPRRGAGGLRRLLAELLGLALAALGAVALGAAVPRGPATGAPPGSERVLLLAGPIHTDLALPLDARTRARFGFVAEAGVPLDHPSARWLVVGWGGRAFYLGTRTWADLRPGPVARALTLDRAALHVDVLGAVAVPQDGVLALDLDPAARERLEATLLAAFARDGAGRPVPIAEPGYGPTDRFFEALGRFNLLAGCNTWTATALRSAGLRTGAWTPLPRPLLGSVARLNPALVAATGG